MPQVAGVDGCRSGWVVVLRDLGSGAMQVRVVETIHELLRSDEGPVVVGIDIPVGLLDRAVPGGRKCDREARIFLGWPRRCSVFSPPVRPALHASSYAEALSLNCASSTHALGISRQSFALLPKIREADTLMSPSMQDRMFEVHPEVSFRELHRAAVRESKKSTAGRRDRIRALERAWERRLEEVVEGHRSSTVARDDIVDAMVACWTAERIHAGTEAGLPAVPPRDSRGLRMEIVR